MADQEQLEILKQGAEAWYAWRIAHPSARPDLRGADFSGADLREANLSVATLGKADLSGADLSWANLSWANLREADLREATLREANLREADLSGAKLSGANLFRANLREADLNGASLFRANLSWAYFREADLNGANLSEVTFSGADLSGATLSGADLSGADLSGVNLSGADLNSTVFYETVLANLDLSSCKGLERCAHRGPSNIDIRTLQRSGSLPLAFLRGVGLSDKLIDYLPSLLNQPIQYYSCFISYSSQDQEFADRLHSDLQNKGVRCWFAPHDMAIGAKIIDAIDEAIRLRDKVLLILSKHSIESDWVEGEVTRSLDEERERKQTVLFPIRLDGAVLETKKAWTRLLRGQRNIGDFTCWKDYDAYQKALDRLLRDLRAEVT